MRERYAGVSGRRNGGCNAGNHFEAQSGVRQRFRLFAAAPEHKRIAALEPHYALAVPRQIYQQPIDVFLAVDALAGDFADVD